MAIPDAADETDVAAVPGRLHAMRGAINVPSNPEFGASQHVATTLLAATAADPSIRGAINLATTDALLAAVPESVDIVEFDAEYEDRRGRLDDLFADGVPRILYHQGAFGIEPITYVLGESAVAAVETATDLIVEAGTGTGTGTDPGR
jgi:predicted fused transcriptional regulator/phosphomethylpyrimidine kinase